MATEPTAPPPPTVGGERTPFLDWYAARSRRLPTILLAKAGILAIGAIALFWLGRRADPPLDGGSTGYLYFGLLLSLLSIISLGVGLWLQFQTPEQRSQPKTLRMSLLVIGSLIGLTFALMAIVFQVRYLSYLTDWVADGKKEHAAEVILMLFTLVGGLVLGFVSVQLARTEERNDPTLRRVMYGYGTFVNALLLLLILAVVNVVLFYKLPARLDTTKSHFYTLQPEAEKVIESLDQPVRAYLIMFDDDESPLQLYNNMRSLLTNAESVNSKFRSEVISPGLSGNRIRELREKYPIIKNQEGLLLVYGERDEQSEFIPVSEMFGVESPHEMMSRGPMKQTFQGEGKLIEALRGLASDKNKPVIYFTAGHGELSINDLGGADRGIETATRLRDYLVDKRKMEVKTFEFDPIAATPKPIPDDATVVIVAGPTRPFKADEVEVLRQYVNGPKKGKLICLFDGTAEGEDRKIQPTGLEPLLEEHNIQVEPRLLMTLDRQGIFKGATVIVNPELVQIDNRIASRFAGRTYDLLYARPIELVSSDKRNPAYRAEELLLTSPTSESWQLMEDPREFDSEAFFKEMRNPAKRREVLYPSRLVSTAVLVSESAPPTGERTRTPDQPKLAVYGSSISLRDSVASRRPTDTRFFELIATTVNWLRARPDDVPIEPKEYTFYTLDKSTSGVRLVFIPPFLMGLVIIGMGLGVWLVRRR